jgi:hypothetical protein
MSNNQFPPHVIEICTRAVDVAGDAAALHAWLRERFGPPPVAPPATMPAVPAVTVERPADRAAAG